MCCFSFFDFRTSSPAFKISFNKKITESDNKEELSSEQLGTADDDDDDAYSSSETVIDLNDSQLNSSTDTVTQNSSETTMS